MKKSSTVVSKQKNRIPPKQNGSNYLIAVILGGLIGAGAMYMMLQHTVPKVAAKPVAKLNETHLPIKRKTANLVNPILEAPAFTAYNFTKVSGLKSAVEKEISSLERKKDINSVSVYFRDLTNDDWFGINETEVFSPASLMKVPVMMAVLALADEQPDLLSTKIPFTDRKEKNYYEEDVPPSTTPLIIGRAYTVNQLLEIMILESDNEATLLLLAYLSNNAPTKLSKIQSQLGLKIPIGAKKTVNFVSVKTYSSFFRSLYNSSVLSTEMSEKGLNILSQAGYGYGIRQAVPSQVIVCHKFGYKKTSNTERQLHHFGIVYHQNKPFLIGIMTKGTSKEKQQNAIAQLAGLVFQKVDSQTKVYSKNIERDLE